MSSPRPTRRELRSFITLLLALLAVGTVIFALATDYKTGRRLAQPLGDAPYYQAYLPSLLFDRDLDFRNEYRITKNFYQLKKTPTGRPGNVFGIGPALFEVPFFLVGHGVAKAAGDTANGFSPWEVGFTLWASLVYSLGSLVPAYLLLRRRLGTPWVAIVAPIVLTCAGPVVYYATRQPGYSHPMAAFITAWLVERWDASFDGSERPRSWRTWLLLGALVGLAALARPQLALWGLVLVVAAADDVKRIVSLARASSSPQARRSHLVLARLGASAGAWALAGVAAFLAFLPQLLAWKAIYGDWFLVPQGDGFMRWNDPAWSEVLFASRNGLLPWSPLYAWAALGLLASAVRAPRLGAVLVLGVAAQTWANGAVWDWWAGGSFGGRRFDSCTIAFAYGLGWLLVAPSRWCAARATGPRASRWRAVGVGARASVLLGAVALMVANLQLAGSTSWRTAPLYAEGAAWKAWRRKAVGPSGRIAMVASHLANLPARWAFAAHYGVSTDRYDELVGRNLLDELFPGLNTVPQPTSHVLWPNDSGLTFLEGMTPLPPMRDAMTDPRRLRTSGPGSGVFMPFNRRGPVRVTVRLSYDGGAPGVGPAVAPGAASAPPTITVLRWNGAEVARFPVDRAAIQVSAELPVQRGINFLELDGPVGLLVHRVTVKVP